MKKIIFAMLFAALMMAVPVLAAPAGNSSVLHLYLYEKDPGDWTIVEDGAWGKMTYNTASGKFVFNGHGLEAGADYSLINFARDGTEWPATVNIFGSAVANEGGNVHIAGVFDYSGLEYDTTPSSGSTDGYKIWLVLTGDLADSTLSGWDPTEYLFEFELI